MVRIRDLNTTDDAEVRAYYDIYRRAERDGNPDARVYSYAETAASVRGPSAGMSFQVSVAEVDEVAGPVGAVMTIGSTTDNLRSAWVAVHVLPEHTGNGVGTALLATGEQRMAEQGRTELTAEFALQGDRVERNRGFAERHGYRWTYNEVERRLPLPIDDGLLDELDAEARPHRTGYRLVTFDGPVPQQWAQGYCDVNNRLVLDAPHGDLEVEARRRTPELLAEQDAEINASGRRRVSALAIAPDGSVAALSSCVISDPDEESVDQWATVVDRAHRGHRLGMSVKVAGYRLLRDLAPDKRYLQTGNAETNRWMIAINEAFGFAVHSTIGVFVKRID
ncbi:GNAT family N-acetyltransferase [Microlunatus soli]|nr:GNAT family N-acetyltransferase [Microlunatus soli]